MKGKYHIRVQNNRVRYEFDIKRNITIIRGDSATGKTQLFQMIDVFNRMGADSGVEVIAEKNCITVNSSNWEMILDNQDDCIVFIDEDSRFIKTQEFARKVRETGFYYVIITRERLPNLPYSVEEIYGIHSSGRFKDLKKTYNEFYRLYSFDNISHNKMVQTVIVEDSGSGLDFYKSICRKNVTVISAMGKTNIKTLLNKFSTSVTLVVADGAAFGSEMDDIYLYMQMNHNLMIYLPESFEWIILKSGLIDGNRIKEILEQPELFIDSKAFLSWENYFTALLIQETLNTYLQYSKSKLNTSFLNEKERNQILSVLSSIRKYIS